MERNRLLKLASSVCSVFAALQIAGIILATFALVYWHINKDFFREIKVGEKGNVNFRITESESEGRESGSIWIEKSVKHENEKLALSDLTPVTVYIAYLQGVSVLIFIFLIFKVFGNVVRSVRSFQTFQNENVESFRRIGKYLLVIFLVSGPGFFATEPLNAHISWDFSITPLFLMLVAYVLAEIFKEGNRLYEDELLTV